MNPTTTQPTEAPKTSGLALTSMIMGILSCTFVPLILTIPAIILGAIGMNKVTKAPHLFTGKGMALTGIITGSVGIFTGIFTLGILAGASLPAIKSAQRAAVHTKNATDIRQIILGCKTYAFDNEGAFPDSLATLYPDYIDDKSIFSYTAASGERIEYTYVKGLKETDSPRTPIVYTEVATNGKRVVGFIDGHVELGRDIQVPDE